MHDEATCNVYSLYLIRLLVSSFIRPTKSIVLWYDAGVCLSVRLTAVGLSAKLVNTIQTEPFHPSSLVHILLMK